MKYLLFRIYIFFKWFMGFILGATILSLRFKIDWLDILILRYVFYFLHSSVSQVLPHYCSMLFEPRSMLFEPGSMLLEPGSMLFESGSMLFEPGSMLFEPGYMLLQPGSLLIKPDHNLISRNLTSMIEPDSKKMQFDSDFFFFTD